MEQVFKKLILASIFLLFTTFPAFAINYCNDSNNELCYRLNESSGDAIDESGNSYDGTLNGATQGATGQFGDAYSFATNDWVSIGDRANLDFGTGVICVVFWAKIPAISDNMTVIGKQDTGSGWYIYVNDSAGDGLTFWNRATSKLFTESSIQIDDNIYRHFAVIRASTNKMYFNGVLQTLDNETEVGGDVNSAGDVAEMGRRNLGGTDDRYLTATLDEMAIFGDELTSTEVNDIMDNGLVSVSADPAPGLYGITIHNITVSN